MKEFIIDENQAGQRLDKLLMKILNQAGSSFIYKMLRKKNIKLNQGKVQGNELLEKGDVLTIYLSDETFSKFSEQVKVEKVEAQPLSIIYEDSHVLFINKEVGMLSQPAAKGDITLTEHVVSYLLETNQLTKEDLQSFRPGVCNRLDRNTSGIIVAGKTLPGLQEMSLLLKERSFDKYYLTVVNGVVKTKERISGYLVKSANHNTVSIFKEEPETEHYKIETEYEPLMNNGEYTLLRVKLITGRSHQIRAHLASIGHAVIGDGKYGDKQINKYMYKKYRLKYQLLHSYQMVFPKLDGVLQNLSERTIEAELPKQFAYIVKDMFGWEPGTPED